MYLTTEIYFTELSQETQDELTKNVIDSLNDDKEILKEINQELDEENKIDEIENETKEHRKWAVEMKLEEMAEDIINRTFYGEVNIGDEN